MLRGLEIIGKDVLRHFALQYAMTDKGVKEFEAHKIELLNSKVSDSPLLTNCSRTFSSCSEDSVIADETGARFVVIKSTEGDVVCSRTCIFS
jgi:hypothetical protein